MRSAQRCRRCIKGTMSQDFCLQFLVSNKFPMYKYTWPKTISNFIEYLGGFIRISNHLRDVFITAESIRKSEKITCSSSFDRD